jgi:hypothetical protein
VNHLLFQDILRRKGIFRLARDFFPFSFFLFLLLQGVFEMRKEW